MIHCCWSVSTANKILANAVRNACAPAAKSTNFLKPINYNNNNSNNNDGHNNETETKNDNSSVKHTTTIYDNNNNKMCAAFLGPRVCTFARCIRATGKCTHTRTRTRGHAALCTSNRTQFRCHPFARPSLRFLAHIIRGRFFAHSFDLYYFIIYDYIRLCCTAHTYTATVTARAAATLISYRCNDIQYNNTIVWLWLRTLFCVCVYIVSTFIRFVFIAKSCKMSWWLMLCNGRNVHVLGDSSAVPVSSHVYYYKYNRGSRSQPLCDAIESDNQMLHRCSVDCPIAPWCNGVLRTNCRRHLLTMPLTLPPQYISGLPLAMAQHNKLPTAINNATQYLLRGRIKGKWNLILSFSILYYFI